MADMRSPLSPFVNWVVHDLPVLDTRIVLDAAFDHALKITQFRFWNIFLLLSVL